MLNGQRTSLVGLGAPLVSPSTPLVCQCALVLGLNAPLVSSGAFQVGPSLPLNDSLFLALVLPQCHTRGPFEQPMVTPNSSLGQALVPCSLWFNPHAILVPPGAFCFTLVSCKSNLCL